MIGIIAAMEIESKKILSVMENKETKNIMGIPFTSGKVLGKDVVIAVCGIGKVFAAMCATVMINEYKPCRIVNCGVGGALVEGMEIGDALIATGAVQHDMDTSALGDPKGLISGINVVTLPCVCPELEGVTKIDAEGDTVKVMKGIVASGDRFVSLRGEKEMIAKEFGASVCEMEGASIAQVCYVAGVPCTILRTVSDTLEGGDVDFERFKEYAANISNAVLKIMIENN
ncbi:MAG: 5'-methylthioadenosine/adenosylhomocysteine nucleosidase [Ruminococcaceae bacterium]|nr:5'-methylthioadenosine/adenosylhomocysteine nucleosidase [Oscillospiraceae bacterium]